MCLRTSAEADDSDSWIPRMALWQVSEKRLVGLPLSQSCTRPSDWFLLFGTALPCLLGPGLRGVTPKSTSLDGLQATSSTLLVPVPSFDRWDTAILSPTSWPPSPHYLGQNLLASITSSRSGPHGPGPGTSRGPRSHGWKDAFQWMSGRVSSNTLWDAVSWVRLPSPVLDLQCVWEWSCLERESRNKS